MRNTIVAAALFLAGGLAAQAAEIGGTYDVRGTNFDGSTYGGTATLTITSETTCRIEWTTGGSSSAGICMRNGIALAAGYTLGEVVGLVIYEILGDGTLDGLWTIAGQDGVGTELLIPQ